MFAFGASLAVGVASCGSDGGTDDRAAYGAPPMDGGGAGGSGGSAGSAGTSGSDAGGQSGGDGG
jgi:hypothetical protein